MTPDEMEFVAVGDSKSLGETYKINLATLLYAATNKPWTYSTMAASGRTVATAQDNVDAELAASTATPDYILCNLGAVDVLSLPLEAAWKADYQYIIDAYHTKWPTAKIYLMRVWRRDYGAECNTVAGWIADLVAANSGIVFSGPDERVFLEGGDDGATYTSDGLHPNTAGYALTAAQWQTAIGL